MNQLSSRCSFLLRAPLLLIGLLIAPTAVAQTPSWSPDYATAGLGGRVFACETYAGDLYAGGWWFAAKGGVIRGVARYDGRDWRAVSTGIDLVNGSAFGEPQVRAMTVFRGELVVAGRFDRAGGQAIDQIASWNGTAFRALGTGLQLSFGDADVLALAVFNNELYAAGQFDRAGGIAVNGIARWDGTTWRAVGNGLRMNGGSIVGHARALEVHNGALFVGGEFDRADALVVRNVAVWNGTAWAALGTGAQYPVYALAAYGTDLVAAGQFQIGQNVEMLAAWNGTTWRALGSGGPDLPVLALCAIGGQLYAGGQFVSPGPYLARFDGTSWANVGGVSGVFSGTTNTSVFALHEHGTELIIGGEFTTAGIAPGAVGAARSANIGTFDGAGRFGSLGGGLGVDRPIQKFVEWRGKLIAVGGFSGIGAVRAVGLAAFDGDRWTTMGAFDGGVCAATIHQGELIVSGVFTQIDGRPFPGIARHDGVRWLPFGNLAPPGLHAQGSELFGFGGGAGLQRCNGSTFVTVALPNTVVSHLHSHTDGRLYASSDSAFTHAIYVWTGSQLQQIGTPNDFVPTLGSYGSELLVGGRFTALSGVAASLIARWDGATWRAMPPPVSGYSAEAFSTSDPMRPGVVHLLDLMRIDRRA